MAKHLVPPKKCGSGSATLVCTIFGIDLHTCGCIKRTVDEMKENKELPTTFCEISKLDPFTSFLNPFNKMERKLQDFKI
jgi:ABC-type dipeptide/oligopeptide/nickel transport system ATPase subunit